ncbi:MAG: GTP diphosphokinase [Anaerolineae bacterium]|nr:GTP diphosphokinase [Anaerolineae bacterium]MCB0223081.1 GTP diphosphokinase [Anaerolineae bacterium]MCB9106478.1 GTP diphosphokinase [Anaerolineales bacterium]
MVAVKSEITTEDAIQFESWLQSISGGRSNSEIEFIRRACEVAQQAHHGQTRASGEPYFQHSLSVANILADLRLDYETIAAALLHDVLEDTPVTYQELEAEFGTSVAQLVDGVTKMSQIQEYRGQSKKSKKEQAQAESLRKMFLAMVDDVRVVLIKLADRTHNMRTLHHLPEQKRKRIARETLEIFAPLANRLGIWQIKWELEDLSFRYMEPELYKQIAQLVDERRINRERYINEVAETLKTELLNRGIDADVTGRPKHIYSIWRKMRRKGVDFDQIYDVRAVRVLVLELADCYASLGIVHTLWRPIPGEFDDYIAAPKDNLYRSLHTAVIGPGGKNLEVQIRTFEMHQEAELGVAAHWRYKEGAKSDPSFDRKINWLRSLMEWKEDVSDAGEFIDQVKAEVFQDRVHVLTPDGDVVDLPFGSTPIDFAYHIHTEVGHRCRGAKVNGRIVPLNYQLKNGDQVEILTAKRGGPSRDWINPHLNYIKTSRARSKVRYWFKYQNFEKNLSDGRFILEREIRRLGIPGISFEKLAHAFKYDRVDDFLAAIGRNDISTPQMVNVINSVIVADEPHAAEEWRNLISLPAPSQKMSTGIHVQGVGNLLTNLAQCCRPVPGDTEILGYITRGRGVTIHRGDCPNVLRLREKAPERLIKVDWGTEEGTTYPVDIQVEAFDRPGLLHDITSVVANEKINLATVNVVTKKQESKANIFATLDIANIDQLSRVLAIIEQLPNVIEVRRRT